MNVRGGASLGAWVLAWAAILVALPAGATPPGPSSPPSKAAAPDSPPPTPVEVRLKDAFREDTETRDRRTERRYVAERAEHVLNDFVDIGGYLRSGYARSGAGGPMAAFQAPGAATKYRLGNEAENYGEIILGKNFYLPGVFALDDAPRQTAR